MDKTARSQERESSEVDPYSAPHIYYGKENNGRGKPRTYSATHQQAPDLSTSIEYRTLSRRGSHDELMGRKRVFKLPVAATLAYLHEHEDTDKNGQITIEDKGSKVIHVGTLASNGYKKLEIRGQYMISNLLQELTLAQEMGRTEIVVDEERLNQNAVQRMTRSIQHNGWPALTRVIDSRSIEKAGLDPKDWTGNPQPRIYVPAGAPEQLEYYQQVARDRPQINLDVCLLPAKITPEYVLSLNAKPGLLALAMKDKIDPSTGKKTLEGLPFIVPGGRFNELYGWDSYMESLGLIAHGMVHLAKNMVIHFCFEIEHYGKILNANRSYYLSRSQPPFLTDMALRVFEKIKSEPDAIEFLRKAILAAAKEWSSVWMSEPRYDPVTGLSRYRPEGLGIPPETEATHFTHLLEPYAKKNNVSFEEFVEKYNNKEILEPELDEYFLHDRAVRESGHDTSYRLEGCCANLATVDLNSLLYKYEKDISHVLRKSFNGSLVVPPEFAGGEITAGMVLTPSFFDRKARKRKQAMDTYLWNEEKGLYFDYDTVKQSQTDYESVTTFWPLWSGVATPHQAMSIVKNLKSFEAAGGLLAGTERSRGKIGLDRPNRQWDYPYGWAPHQILAWSGMRRYGFFEDAERCAYKWLFMMITAFVDYNGTIVEKYDVTRIKDPHRVDAEYGNQGLDFKGVAKEGFGWVNASFVIGLEIVSEHMRRALGTLTDWERYKKAIDSIVD